MYNIPNLASGSGGDNNISIPQAQFDSLGGSGGAGGQNQWMSFPSMTSPSMPSGSGAMDVSAGSSAPPPPGIVPPSGGGGTMPLPVTNPNQTRGGGQVGGVGTGQPLPGGQKTVPTMDPGFTQAFDNWLRSMMGKGATPFDLSAIMPDTGTATAPGTLSAPENSILQSLQQFYTTGTGGPMPGVLPMWQNEMTAMQQPIQQNLANLKEQFGARGALGSSEMGTAMENYLSQTSADENKLLGEMTLQALPGMESAGMNQQNIDQNSIDRMVQEFIRTQPENSPLLGIESGFATAYPPAYGAPGFGQAFKTAFGGALGSSLGSFNVSGGSGTTPTTVGLG